VLAVPAGGSKPRPDAVGLTDPAFATDRAVATVRALVALGPREASGPTYRRAARLVREQLSAFGYAVRSQTFDVPGGSVDGFEVSAGTSLNVVAEPFAFDPSEPHLVVGAHLDTVPDSPGANDNGSGIGVLVELARLTSFAPPPMPVVFVALGAEERRRQSPSQSEIFLGASAYIDRMGALRRTSLRGMMNLDMVGNGDEVLVLGGEGPLAATALARARRLDIPARPSTLFDRYSDHQAFREAGYPVVWFWAGNHPSLHRPSDTMAVIEEAEMRRVGRLAWATLRALRLD